MDLQVVQKGLNFSERRKKWLFLMAAFGVTSYGVYKFYHSPSIVKKRKRLLKFLKALISVAEVLSDSAEIIGIVSKDLKEFLDSDSDEIPNSLKQISKIARSEDFSESLIRVTEGLTVGILRGYKFAKKEDDVLQTSSDFLDRIIDRLFSTAGTGFASVVVGSFARNLVLAFYTGGQSSEDSNLNEQRNISCLGTDLSSMSRWVDVICSNNCKELIADCIQFVVSTAVTVYLEKTMGLNTFDHIFSGMTNPKHGTRVRDVMTSVCNGAVETLVKTSHQVLMSSTLNVKSSSISHGVSTKLKERNLFYNNGWVGKVSSTLGVPSNRKFVLDMTGRVTFETVRSFMDFLLWKLMDGLKRSVDVVHEEVIERGFEVVRYISAKSAVIVTLSFALCLHVLGGVMVLIPT